MNEFSEKITAARKAKGLSQKAAAELLSVSRQAVAKWENGKSRPSAESLLALSKLYGIPPEELSPVLPSAGSRKTSHFAGIFCGASAVFAALAAAAAVFGKAGIGTALCCFIIALPVQLFVHLYFRSSISGGDFSGIAGFDDSVEYNIPAVKSYLEKLDLTLCALCTAHTGFLALSGFFAPPSRLLPALMLLFCSMCVGEILVFNIKFSAKIYVHEEDYLRAKRSYPSVCIFIAFLLMSIAEMLLVFEHYGIENSSAPALISVGIMLPAWAAAICGFLLEQRRLSESESSGFGKAFAVCYIIALLLAASLPFAAKFA